MEDIRPFISPNSGRFLDQFRLHIRQNGLAYRTEQTYLHWVKRFIRFHDRKHPKDLCMTDVETFLSHLAEQRTCSTNTQRIALNALVYLYKRFMGLDIGSQLRALGASLWCIAVKKSQRFLLIFGVLTVYKLS